MSDHPKPSSSRRAKSESSGLHLMKCLAQTQGSKVRVNAVLPGLLLTEWVSMPYRLLPVAGIDRLILLRVNGSLLRLSNATRRRRFSIEWSECLSSL